MMIVNPGVRRNLGRGVAKARQIVTNLSATYNGALYDYPNISSLYDNYTGTIPVAAVTDPVGLSLDSRLGLVLGPELISNGAFGTDLTGWSSGATFTSTAVAVGGEMQVTATANFGRQLYSFTTVVGKTYQVIGKIRLVNGVGTAYLAVATSGEGDSVLVGANTTSASFVTRTAVFVATGTTTKVACANGTINGVSGCDDISVKLLDGNHAIQATAAARPTWSNRVNLLTHTNDLTHADWTKTGVVASSSSLTFSAADHVAYQFTSLNPAVAGVFSIILSGTVGKKVNLYLANSAATIGAGVQVVLTATPTRYEIASSLAGATDSVCLIDNRSFFGIPVGDTVMTVNYSEIQVEYGTTATRYQRSTTATDFDTVGFPYYLSFLGTDDCLTSATGGGGSAGFFWCGVVQPTGGAGTFRTLFSNYTGTSGYHLEISASNILAFYAGNGTVFTIKTSTATVDVGTKYLLTAWDDGTNLNVQINSAAVETVTRPVVVAGPANFSISKDNTAASSFFIGNLYASVYFKDTGLTAAQRAAAQAWARAKGGM